MKTVVVQKFPRSSETTLNEVSKYMEDYARKHPGREVFFDGDRYAVCYIRS